MLLDPQQKQALVADAGRGRGIVVETGTFLGDMVEACRTHFREVYSIEISPELYERACKRFALASDVHLFHGDSGTVLPEVLAQIHEPALFWLDAHYSGGITALGEHEPPLDLELTAIFERAIDPLILIDDARGLDVRGVFAAAWKAGMACSLQNDIIRIWRNR